MDFDDSICGNEVQQGKPHSEIFLTACRKLGVEPKDALEDSEAGMMATYSGNIDVICIPNMKYPELEYVNKTTKSSIFFRRCYHLFEESSMMILFD